MSSHVITSQREFEELCQRIREAGLVAFDTEFVSESTYRPRLSLLQFAVQGEAVAVDPLVVRDLSPWWEIMGDDTTTVIAHGSREEIKFCVSLGGLTPRKLIDVQIAEGLLTRGYPVGHSQLVLRVLGLRTTGKQTRTDWERRPLREDQLQYALEDVEHLEQVWITQAKALEELGRLDWAFAEFDRYTRLISSEPLRGDWRRLPGANRLARREMGVLQELQAWRENVAERSDKPARWILRDDILVELAKLHPKSSNDLMQMRAMQQRGSQRFQDEILHAVRKGMEIPDANLPEKPVVRRGLPDFQPLTRLLAMALANRCADLSISMSLVGTTSDLEALIRWHSFDNRKGETPSLMVGWREEV
ncbi:MAG: HRDC domain-containing protein, partial [Planctomycetaceae bacterium]